MNVEEVISALVADPPKIHSWYAGQEPVGFAFGDETLRFFARAVKEGSRTLETGIGSSTVVFAALRAAHTVIAPFAEEHERLKEYCRSKDVPTDTVTFVTEPSDRYLPRVANDGPLDLVLIDGGHGFPIPFIDWHYTAHRLRAGGTLLIDDTQLWTGHALVEFLKKEPDWRYECGLSGGKTAVFSLFNPYTPGKEWVCQPFVSAWTPQQASTPAEPSLFRRAGRRIKRVMGF